MLRPPPTASEVLEVMRLKEMISDRRIENLQKLVIIASIIFSVVSFVLGFLLATAVWRFWV